MEMVGTPSCYGSSGFEPRHYLKINKCATLQEVSPLASKNSLKNILNCKRTVPDAEESHSGGQNVAEHVKAVGNEEGGVGEVSHHQFHQHEAPRQAHHCQQPAARTAPPARDSTRTNQKARRRYPQEDADQ
jgi:hypothetical protein